MTNMDHPWFGLSCPDCGATLPHEDWFCTPHGHPVTLVNLTPHAIHLHVGDQVITIPPSGMVARCQTQRQQVRLLPVVRPGASTADDYIPIPIMQTTFGTVEGLPDPAPYTMYIVSSLVAQAAKGRNDLLIPDDTVRDNEGRIIGCRALARI